MERCCNLVILQTVLYSFLLQTRVVHSVVCARWILHRTRRYRRSSLTIRASNHRLRYSTQQKHDTAQHSTAHKAHRKNKVMEHFRNHLPFNKFSTFNLTLDHNYRSVYCKWFSERIHDISIRGKVRIRNSHGTAIQNSIYYLNPYPLGITK